MYIENVRYGNCATVVFLSFARDTFLSSISAYLLWNLRSHECDFGSPERNHVSGFSGSSS